MNVISPDSYLEMNFDSKRKTARGFSVEGWNKPRINQQQH